jgi:hypothetical protein
MITVSNMKVARVLDAAVQADGERVQVFILVNHRCDTISASTRIMMLMSAASNDIVGVGAAGRWWMRCHKKLLMGGGRNKAQSSRVLSVY